MKNCHHQFHTLAAATKMPVGATNEVSAAAWRATPGIEVVCVICGQVRKAYADGVIEITIEGHYEHPDK